VLALDGGGILGAFTAGVLDGLMERAREDEVARARLEGRAPVEINLLDRVDLVAGTSTGGIIALAVAFGASTSEICGFYETHGPSIFPRDPWKIRSMRSILRYRYNPLPLRRAIESVIENKPLSEAGCGVVIPATDVDTGSIHFFKTNHHARPFPSTPNIAAVDVALATSAAPTYFPAHKIDGGVSYVDGGLWANCPASVAMTEAVAYLGRDASSVSMLSISTTNVAYNLSDAKKVGGLLSWARPVIDSLMRFQVEASHSMAKSILLNCGGAYHRIDHFTPEGRYYIDKADCAKQLVGIGRTVGRYNNHCEFFRNKFLTGPPATLHRKQTSSAAIA
jgi:patatin-like phospholipase/acyl hydrolase